ncbi:MAG: class I SAM-dependent methyltransferase [Spirochaetales bacterium]|nr:class I SAM-dependent methyltransferase [Spirochaetales bacterium]
MNDPKQRFTDRASDYSKYRPSYPAEAVRFIADICRIEASGAIADIGSGTGISTAILLEVFALPVYAVEPNDKMRHEAERRLGADPLFHSIDGSAESTTLPDDIIDLAASFQAFHWFDHKKTKREFERILRGKKWVLFVWNDRQTEGTACVEGYNAILEQLPEYPASMHTSTDEAVIRRFLGGGSLITAGFPNSQQLDLRGLKGRFFSSSYTPAVGTDEYVIYMAKLDTLFEKTQKNGIIELLYITRVYLGSMNG